MSKIQNIEIGSAYIHVSTDKQAERPFMPSLG